MLLHVVLIARDEFIFVEQFCLCDIRIHPVAGVVAQVRDGRRIRATALATLLVFPQRLLERLLCVHPDKKLCILCIAVKRQRVKSLPGMCAEKLLHRSRNLRDKIRFIHGAHHFLAQHHLRGVGADGDDLPAFAACRRDDLLDQTAGDVLSPVGGIDLRMRDDPAAAPLLDDGIADTGGSVVRRAAAALFFKYNVHGEFLPSYTAQQRRQYLPAHAALFCTVCHDNAILLPAVRSREHLLRQEGGGERSCGEEVHHGDGIVYLSPFYRYSAELGTGQEACGKPPPS